jgi:RimJ/RimL family protein N-acetyltransferase
VNVLEPAYPLETERLRLRPFAATDFDALYGMQSREDVARYLYWDARSRAEVREALEKKIASTAIRSETDALAMAAVLQQTGELVGDFVLWLHGPEQGEIGFIVHPEHHGRGYATEAGRVLLGLAFEGVGLHRVIACAELRNTASARVLEKLGMRLEARLVENEWVKGEWQSELVYAMLDREWLVSERARREG